MKMSQQPIRDVMVGLFVKYIGALTAFIGFVLIKGYNSHKNLFWAKMGFVLLIIGGLTAVIGYLVGSKDALKVLEQDKRPPVIYLRSFEYEKSLLLKRIFSYVLYYGGYWQNVYTFEEIMSDIFSAFGPFIALGKPGEKLATPGAARTYVGQDEWQSIIRGWINESNFVIVQAGNTNSLLWEIDILVKRNLPKQTLIYIPLDVLKKNKEAFKNEALFFYEFREMINPILPKPLPEKLGETSFIWFDAVWNPIMLPYKKKSLYLYLREDITLKSRPYKNYVEYVNSLESVLSYLRSKTI